MSTKTEIEPLGPKPKKKHKKYEWQFWLIIAVPVIYAFIFAYIPMGGIVLAFKDYSIKKGIFGSPWVGLKYFKQFLTSTSSITVIKNTLILGLYSLAVNFPFPIIFAVLINEMRNVKFKKTVQFISYAPYFISTVVLVGMMMQMMDLRTGVINKILVAIGFDAVNFFGSPNLFRSLYVWSGLWQTIGYSSIIYIAALAGVSPELKEAAVVDGASRLQRIIHVDLPCIRPTVVIMLIFACGNIVNIGFDKVFLMQNSMNAGVSEVISTFVYKVGLVNSDFGFSTAAGLFQSLVSFLLLVIVNAISKKVTETSLW
jgi:multiple sugar transport system permease protein/putative aldouronate transport system permease protein